MKLNQFSDGPRKEIYFSKSKSSLLLLSLGIFIGSPFSFVDTIFIELKLFTLLVISLYVLIINNIIETKKGFKYLLFLVGIIIFLSVCYSMFGILHVNYFIVQGVNLIFMMTIFLFIILRANKAYVIEKFIQISISIALLTNIAFFGIKTGYIPFTSKEVAGYDVKFNYLFGSVQQKFEILQPHFYFFEPSYYGFYLGFCVLYLIEYEHIKFRFLKLIPMLIAGMILFSFTFYISLLIGIVSLLIVKFSQFILNKRQLSILYLVSFIFLSFIGYQYTEKAKETFFSTSTSIGSRLVRVDLSLGTMKSMSAIEKLFGKGTGYVINDDSRDVKESNAYLKIFIENGAFGLLLSLLMIYFFLRDNPSLLIFVLVSLHSVILLETPFFVLLLCLAYLTRREELMNLGEFKNAS